MICQYKNQDQYGLLAQFFAAMLRESERAESSYIAEHENVFPDPVVAFDEKRSSQFRI